MSREEKLLPISPTGDEALVIFDLLQRYEEGDEALAADAEGAALSAMTASLQKHLVAPFKANCAERVEAARDRLWDNGKQ